MNVIKTLLSKIGHLLLSIVRVLRKAICCRRRKESEYLLPMTVNDINMEEQRLSSMLEFPSQWETWPESEGVTPPISAETRKEEKTEPKNFHPEDAADDFFKDMVPQIRKPKKLYIRKDLGDSEETRPTSNRLAMDPKAILTDPDLGVIDDNPSNWEDAETAEDVWDTNMLIRETKRAEREKRLADHQRRKLEKESRRASKQETASNLAALSLSDSKDKPKYS